ncbi:hypothetical protein ACVIVD_008624 [Bradyrhizobium liaoningense]
MLTIREIRRKIRRILAQERRQRLLEVARRDASQVQNRQKCIQALRAPCPQRQDRRGEADPLAMSYGGIWVMTV